MAGKRGRPPAFTREELIRAALDLGPDFTLKAVADRLGVARNSLYWHVRAQADLGAMVMAHLAENAGTHNWAPGDDASWDEWLGGWAVRERRTLLATGPWIRYATANYFYTPQALHLTDRMVAKLLDAGFSPDDATRACTFIFGVVFASVRAATDTPVTNLTDTLARDIGSMQQELPALRVVLAAATNVSQDQQFEYALAAALRGIAELAGVPLIPSMI